MKSFLRVLRISLRYRLQVAAIMACSLLIGALWGANIGTFYPVMRVVFHGESLGQSLTRQEAETTAAIATTQQQLAGVEGQAFSAESKSERTRQLASLRARLATDQRALQKIQYWRPIAQRWLPAGPVATMGVVILVLLAGTILKGICLATQEILLAGLSNRTLFDIRARFFRHVLRMDLQMVEQDRASKLLSHFTYDIQMIGSGIQEVFGSLVREPLKIVACLIGAAAVSWQLLLLSSIIAPIGVLVMRRIARTARSTNHQSMDAMSTLYGRISASLNSVRVIKAFTMERSQRRRFHEASRNIYRQVMRVVAIQAFVKPVTEVLGFLIVTIALMVGTYLVVNEQTHLLWLRMSPQPLSPEGLMLFFGFMIGLTDPIHRLSGISVRLWGSAAGAERIYGIMQRPPTITDPEIPQHLPEQGGDVVLENVGFQYYRDTPVLHSVNLRVRRGECVAIVGHNGCGKSTLVNLLPRFYDPTSGKVTIGNVNVRDVRLKDLRSAIGMVTQTTMLFDDTVLNNIREGRPSATEAEIIRAAQQAEAHEFITNSLPSGYHTVVGESCNFLSGGQAQRISLARAILRDPSLLILDEPTSSIDAEAEQSLLRTMSKFVKGRTTILITHRPAALSLADRIVVMETGRIVDQGTYLQLAERCELFRQLSQAKVPVAA